MTIKTIAQGFGVAMLLLISRVAPLISPYHLVLYHSMLPMRSVVWGTLMDLFVVTLLAALLIRFLEKRPSGVCQLAWGLIAALLVHMLLGFPVASLGWVISRHFRELAVVGIILCALLLRSLSPRVYRVAASGLLAVLLLAGCNALWMVPELCYLALRAGPTDAVSPVTLPISTSAQSVAASRKGRVVWLLFDELSYDQIFDHRFPGLALPTFERLKRESVVFSNVTPAGSSTDLVIPALFLGTPVRKVRSNPDGEPSFQMGGSDDWQTFESHSNLFLNARRLGWTTGVVGWFNPYCRILSGALDHCYWRMGDGEFGGPVSTDSAFKNAVSPVRNTLWWLGRKPDHLQRVHSEDLSAIVPAAQALIRDERIRFLFIHLPVPHPPGIYDRAHKALRAGGSYVDNLALSDVVLEQLLSTVQATSVASNTAIIVCSDHSWRVSLWRSKPLWTKEDEAASGGRVDPRPVLMVHAAGQTTEQDVSAPFDELWVHAMIERLLQGKAIGPPFNSPLGED